MVAIFETGGKQYKVTEGDVIFVERREAAEGETVICDDGHVTRGYERFDRRLRSLGADIYLEY